MIKEFEEIPELLLAHIRSYFFAEKKYAKILYRKKLAQDVVWFKKLGIGGSSCANTDSKASFTFVKSKSTKRFYSNYKVMSCQSRSRACFTSSLYDLPIGSVASPIFISDEE